MIKLLNGFFPLWDFLYILQLEEYQLQRYWHQVGRRLYKRGFQKRDTLHYTGRIKLTIGLLLLILAALVAELVQLQLYVYAILVLATLPLTTPYLIGMVSAVVGVLVALQTKRRLQAARVYFTANYPNTTVIAITGSFGKTTTKYLLQHVLQYDHQVAIIPDNINTSLGIAGHILAGKVPKQTELLVVEMGAYTRGDIAQSAQVVVPDLAIITILGDQHLERFGSHAKLVQGKSELFTTNQQTKCYVTPDSLSLIQEQHIPTNQLQVVPVPPKAKSTTYLVTQLALDLGVSAESIAASVATFNPPDRRNNIIERQGVTIIDNSYNISPMVAEAMLQEAARTAATHGKQLVVMTAGIGEQGTAGPAANNRLGELINQYGSRVILHPSVFAKDVERALSVPFVYTAMGLDVSQQPARWLDGDLELLLWLTDHGDEAYL